MIPKTLANLLLCKLLILSDFTTFGQWNIPGIPSTQSASNYDDRAHYDEKSKTLTAPKFNTKSYTGKSMNFHGADIANAHLVNATIDGYIPHLAIDTLEVRSETTTMGDGIRMATFDPRGGLSTASGVKWDDRKETLMLNSLASLSPEGIHILSGVDLNFNELRNFRLGSNTMLQDLRIESSVIVDTVLINATLENLSLDSVQVNSLSIPSMNDIGTFLIVGNDGEIGSSTSVFDSDEVMLFTKQIAFTETVDFKGSKLENVHITSGKVEGIEIDLDVKNIFTNSITLKTLRDTKGHVADALVVVKDDGSLSASSIVLEEDGWVGGMKVSGNIDFKGRYAKTGDIKTPGKILGASIEGGRVVSLEHLSVSGPTSMSDNLDVKGDAFVDGGLTVGGSVLGSGPYIDVSDERLKTKVQKIVSTGMLEKLSMLQGVEYELKNKKAKDKYTAIVSSREIGFIAQEVNQIFPELVTLRPDGYFGVQYSRFIPLVVEGLKDTHNQMKQLHREIVFLTDRVEKLIDRIDILEHIEN
jgi:hypothetical protein